MEAERLRLCDERKPRDYLSVLKAAYNNVVRKVQARKNTLNDCYWPARAPRQKVANFKLGFM